MGFPDQIFVTEPPPELRCPVCDEIVKLPQKCSNEHVFCTQCIKTWLKTYDHCPIDRQKIGADEILPSFSAQNRVSELIVYCAHNKSRIISPTNRSDKSEDKTNLHELSLLNSNCPWMGALGDLSEHLNDCLYSPIECRFKCGSPLIRKDLFDHQEDCPNYPTQCGYCDKRTTRKALVDHMTICPRRPVLCKYCETDVPGCQVHEHIENECPGVVKWHGMSKKWIFPVLILYASLSMFSSLARPDYNVAVSFFGLFFMSTFHRNHTIRYLCVILFTVVLDAIWISFNSNIKSHYRIENLLKFEGVMTFSYTVSVVNTILKIPLCIFVFFFDKRDVQVNMLTTPIVGTDQPPPVWLVALMGDENSSLDFASRVKYEAESGVYASDSDGSDTEEKKTMAPATATATATDPAPAPDSSGERAASDIASDSTSVSISRTDNLDQAGLGVVGVR